MDETRWPVAEALLNEAASLLARAEHAIVLTGAGISKESGIPTFRGKDGLWTLNGEPPLNQFETFSDDPRRWWERRLEQQADSDFGLRVRNAEPNDAHYALSRLETAGIVRHVITQNVDNLHRRAGQRSLTEIHGNSRFLRCMDCGMRWPVEEFPVDSEALPPRCTQSDCAGVVKSDSVMFGEPIPAEALARCEQETRQCDLFLLVGTSAVVYPAAYFPQLAAGEVLPRLADMAIERARHQRR